jgi:hypothetical protein
MNPKLLKILGGETRYYPAKLEQAYPRILNNILVFWGTKEMPDYFTQLMVTDREGRAGFPPEVATEIMRLSLIHASQYGSQKKDDVWDVATDKFASFRPQTSVYISEDWRPLPQATKQAIENFGLPPSAHGFHQAAETGNRQVVALFLSARVNTEVSNSLGCTPLMLAAAKGHTTIIGQLLQHRANVRALDLAGNTPLHWAIEASQVASAKMLLENYAMVDALNNDGLSPLLIAVVRRNLEIVLMLLDKGANPNLVGRKGNTALHQAAAGGFSEIVRALLHDGADPRLKNQDGDTPLMLAEKSNQQSAIKLLSPQ